MTSPATSDSPVKIQTPLKSQIRATVWSVKQSAGILGKRAEATANHITISYFYSVFTYLGTLEISLRAKLTSRFKFTESNNDVFPSHKTSKSKIPIFIVATLTTQNNQIPL